jgi:hypothetical protein
MARRRKSRKLYGAALAAHLKKAGRRSNPRQSKRRRHTVRAHRVKRHMSNPRRRTRRSRRNPLGLSIPRLGGMGGQITQALMAAGALGITFVASAWIGRQVERYVPGMDKPLPNTLAKIGVAALTVYVSRVILKDGGLRKVAVAGAFFPVMVQGVSIVAPGVASQIPMLGYAAPAMIASAPAAAATMQLEAQLEAELDEEREESNY